LTATESVPVTLVDLVGAGVAHVGEARERLRCGESRANRLAQVTRNEGAAARKPVLVAILGRRQGMRLACVIAQAAETPPALVAENSLLGFVEDAVDAGTIQVAEPTLFPIPGTPFRTTRVM
jgi:hypothetical protein